MYRISSNSSSELGAFQRETRAENWPPEADENSSHPSLPSDSAEELRNTREDVLHDEDGDGNGDDEGFMINKRRRLLRLRISRS